MMARPPSLRRVVSLLRTGLLQPVALDHRAVQHQHHRSRNACLGPAGAHHLPEHLIELLGQSLAPSAQEPSKGGRIRHAPPAEEAAHIATREQPQIPKLSDSRL
jgi:hypothetical protein